MVHEDDEKAPLAERKPMTKQEAQEYLDLAAETYKDARDLRELVRRQLHYRERSWQEMPRIKRQQLMEAAYRAEQGLALQIAEAKQVLQDHYEIRRSLPNLKSKVRNEARQILNSPEREQTASDVKAAFDASREAWKHVPTFVRHKHWDTKLKKQALKIIKDLTS